METKKKDDVLLVSIKNDILLVENVLGIDLFCPVRAERIKGLYSQKQSILRKKEAINFEEKRRNHHTKESGCVDGS